MEKRYVEQLLQDLELATVNLPPASSFYDIGKLEDRLLWLRENKGSRIKKISEWTGIKKSAFPPHGQLTPSQMTKLVSAINRLWEAYNWSHDLDIDLPMHIAYQLLTLFWDEPVEYSPKTGFDVNFCRGNRTSCWLKEWCMCSSTPYDNLPDINPGRSNLEDEDISRLFDL